MSFGITESDIKLSCISSSVPGAADALGRGADVRELFEQLVSGKQAHEAADGKFEARENLFALGYDYAAVHTRELAQRGRHRDVVHAGAGVVVCVVRDRRGDGSAFEREVVQEAEREAARSAVLLDDGHLRKAARRVGAGAAVYDSRFKRQRLRRELARHYADDVDIFVVRAELDFELVGRGRPDRLLQPRQL